MNLNDLKAILLAKHAQHIIIIHFPIALFVISVFFDLLASLRHSLALRMVAYYNLLCASLTSVPALATGILAWQLLYDGGRPRGILLLHMLGAGASSALLGLLLVLRYPGRRELALRRPRTYAATALLTVLLIMLTAHLGGILSGVVQFGE